MTGDARPGWPSETTPSPLVVLTAHAANVRRQVGPTAWVVLEAVVADAQTDATGSVAARTNVRRLASVLGLSKDTVAAALARLIGAGLLERRVTRESSRFGASLYVASADVGLRLHACPSASCPKDSVTKTSDWQQPPRVVSNRQTGFSDEDRSPFEALRLFE